MKILQYRFLSTNDIYNEKYKNWSRIYEYPIILNEIGKYQNVKIHNSAWGNEGDAKMFPENHPHVLFREELDKHNQCIHSDLLPSKYDTVFYDITKSKPEYHEMFDIVLNVSVIEHLPKETRVTAMKNLFDQVKPNGLFICTFDYPRVDLCDINIFTGDTIECEKPHSILNGKNSKYPNRRCSNLNIVYLVAKKGS